MKPNTLIAALAGLAAGLGVLVVTIDGASADSSSLANTSTVAPSTTSTPATTSSTNVKVEPTTTTTIESTPPTTTTTTSAGGGDDGAVTFDPRCLDLNLDLGADARFTLSNEDNKSISFVRESLSEALRKAIGDKSIDIGVSDPDGLEEVLTKFENAVRQIDLGACEEVVKQVFEDDDINDNDNDINDNDRSNLWLCLVSDQVEISRALETWALDQALGCGEILTKTTKPGSDTTPTGGTATDDPSTPGAGREPTRVPTPTIDDASREES